MTRNSPAISRRCQFGPYVFDSARGLLWRDGIHVPLTPKTAEVLRVLIDHHGDVVEKSELMQFVWPNAVVEENNLARHISTLRKVLEERRGQHDIISTIPGHGYMFVATVTEADPETESAAAAESHGDDAAAGQEPDESHPVLVDAAPSSRGPSVPARWSIAAAVLFCAGAAGIGIVVANAKSQPGPHRSVDLRQLTFDGLLQRDPAWSPDGNALVYATDRSGNLDLYRRSLTDPAPLRLTNDEADESQADWSPDGKWLAFRSERDRGGIYVMSSQGGTARRVTDGGFDPRWSPDGSRILVTDGTAFATHGFRIVPMGGGETRLVRPDVVSRFRSAYATWHPDGRRVSLAGRHADAPWAFVTVTLDERDPVTSSLPAEFAVGLRDSSTRLGKFVWSRSGAHLYVEGRLGGTHSIWRAAVDPRTLAWTSEPERLYTGPGEYTDLALSPDGRRLAFTVRQERTRVWNFPFDPGRGSLTGLGHPLTAGGPGEYDAAAPLDGSKVAYRTTRGNRHELWERSITGGEHLLSASSEWVPTSPRWSRDGTQLAYMRRLADRSGSVRPAVAIHSAAGSERLLRLPPDTEIVPDDWSSDNALLLAACRRGSGQPMGTCLVSIGSDDAADVRLVASDATRSLICPRFSPDERWISFMAVDFRKRDVSTLYVMPSSGGAWIPISDGRHYDDKPRWSPDGNAVYFLSSRDGSMNLWGQRFDNRAGQPVGEPFRVTAFRGAQQALPRDLGRVEIAVSANNVFLPLTETYGTIWMLEGLAR